MIDTFGTHAKLAFVLLHVMVKKTKIRQVNNKCAQIGSLALKNNDTSKQPYMSSTPLYYKVPRNHFLTAIISALALRCILSGGVVLHQFASTLRTWWFYLHARRIHAMLDIARYGTPPQLLPSPAPRDSRMRAAWCHVCKFRFPTRVVLQGN